MIDTAFESLSLLSVLYPGSINCSHTLTRLNCCPAEDPIDPDPDPEDPDPNPEEEGNDLFFETLVYNGLDIRQIDMGNGCNLGIIRNQYRYDADHRLNSVKNFMIFESETQENNYNSLYEYDAAGNITSLKRRGFLEKDPVTELIIYDDIDDLTYTYGANSSQLDLVKEGILLDRGVKFGNYNLGYDGKGNALSMMGSALSYNPINLPKVISTSTGEERIWYTINGEKFKIMTDTEVTEDEVTTTETKTRYLVQGFELADGGSVHSFNFGDGRVLMPGGEDTLAVPRVQFHIKDHLGNVMVVFEDKDDNNEIDIEDTEEPNEIIERFMYYAFGMQWEGAWMYDEPIDTEENRYRYNGKEYSKGSRLSDYGFRYYSSDIGRFTGVDPIADQFAHVNVYNYAENEPVGGIDLWGLQRVDVNDIRNSQGQITRRNVSVSINMKILNLSSKDNFYFNNSLSRASGIASKEFSTSFNSKVFDSKINTLTNAEIPINVKFNLSVSQIDNLDQVKDTDFLSIIVDDIVTGVSPDAKGLGMMNSNLSLLQADVMIGSSPEVLLHELGHNLGLGHTSDGKGLMGYKINNQTGLSIGQLKIMFQGIGVGGKSHEQRYPNTNSEAFKFFKDNTRKYDQNKAKKAGIN